MLIKNFDERKSTLANDLQIKKEALKNAEEHKIALEKQKTDNDKAKAKGKGKTKAKTKKENQTKRASD